MSGQDLDLAIIGNCRLAALIDAGGRIVWWCFPRFDSDPFFSRLLAGDEAKGFTDVVLDEAVETRSAYCRNTAIVATEITDVRGATVRITDFCPRFPGYGRITRPPQMVRIIEPVSGLPRITIRVRPTTNYGDPITHHTLGSNHISYWGKDTVVRLTTDAPLSYIEREAPFVLTRPVHLVFGADEPFPGNLVTTCRDLHDRTRDYWIDWVRGLSIPHDWQEAVIRAAITLKLSNFEETGGVVAAHTTSIPEAPDSGRTWDYRYCWLRDAYFVVKALNRIGATRTMENFVSFILGIIANRDEALRPVYSVVPTDPMEEEIAPRLAGYRGHGPVRTGNAAALQPQNDTYGSIILAVFHMFFDERLPRPGDEPLFRLLETMGRKCKELALEPDAGLWEYRARRLVHTHSAAMCWAGCDRLAGVAARLGLPDRAGYWTKTADSIRKVLLEKAWNAERGAFTGAFGTTDLDASGLLLAELGLVEPNDPRFVATVTAIEKELLRHNHVMRYLGADDFGLPETAFLVCRFWLIDAWWSMGRRDQAREYFEETLRYRNRFGLLSEDIHPQTGELWGNFPQTYSMGGLIVTATRLSRSWEDRHWRA